MLKKFLQNCKKPEGLFGRMVLKGMNCGHGPVADWAFGLVQWKDGDPILDVGCGGGANIAKLLKKYPHSQVDGIDYSLQSVEISRKVNAAVLGKRCEIRKGDVMELPFAKQSYHRVIAIETVYFWPNLTDGLREAFRVLDFSGEILIVCEMGDPEKGKKWSKHCDGMTVYTGRQLKSALEQAGFSQVQIFQKGVWTAALGKKPGEAENCNDD
ncbi:MAG TPA: class I SAM-dependent methyltransferase [Candidatus Gallacutalibacter pullistercoris]|nr:class I SAM-dependent methyltransferase [Candidatus Gallacutalibacter pullistercoris]